MLLADGSSSEQVWTGLQSWPPGVTTEGFQGQGQGRDAGVPVQRGVGARGSCKEGEGSMYGKVQGMGNG